MSNEPRVLIIGSQQGSLGEAIGNHLFVNGYQVRTAGISGEEEYDLNLYADSTDRLLTVLRVVRPDHIVCTAGRNEPDPGSVDVRGWYENAFGANVIGPMRLLHAWYERGGEEGWAKRHYVAVSSNSARVPRTGSGPYCASKAALSMALRCAAREYATVGGPTVWGVEPGLIAGTPMTDAVAERFAGLPLTRMRPPELSAGISPAVVADAVLMGLRAGRAMSGVLLPLDADEA